MKKLLLSILLISLSINLFSQDTLYIDNTLIIKIIPNKIFIGDDWTGLTNMAVTDTLSKLVFNYGSIRSDSKAVLNNYGRLYIVEKDSLLNMPLYSFTVKLERTAYWPEANTTYKLIDIPFYFYKSDSILSTDPLKYRTFANKKHCIRHIINGITVIGTALYNSTSCNPGNSSYAGGSFRHTNRIDGLIDGINIIRFEALDINTGEIIGIREITFKK